MQVLDPYAVLGVAYDANDEEIRQAFYLQMKRTNGSAEIVNAYDLIRTKKARLAHCWTHVCSLICPPTAQTMPPLDLEALIRQFAFQSEWELGDDACLMKD